MGIKEFVDERALVSHDTFGRKEMKIKIVEVSDENPPSKWKFGDRVKVNKILVTVKHVETQQVEEGEFDIQSIEKELQEKHLLNAFFAYALLQYSRKKNRLKNVESAIKSIKALSFTKIKLQFARSVEILGIA